MDWPFGDSTPLTNQGATLRSLWIEFPRVSLKIDDLQAHNTS